VHFQTGRGAVLQTAWKLTTLISDCAMRQNAWYRATVKLPSTCTRDNEIDPLRARCELPFELPHVYPPARVPI
jgi:hypothetical protein